MVQQIDALRVQGGQQIAVQIGLGFVCGPVLDAMNLKALATE
jgi:hypothetical protein